MGSIAITTGTVRARDCPELRDVLKNLNELAEGMDERQIDVRKADEARYGASVLEVEVCISGHTSASRASAIDEKIRELGAYAVEAGSFRTEWECEKDHFFVGTDTQVAVAESADALDSIRSLVPKLRMDRIDAALEVFFDLEEADPGAAVTDTLTDLRHYCDRHELDLGALDRLAHSHYLAELQEGRYRPGKKGKS